VCVPSRNGAVDRLTGDGFELFPPDAEGILRWIDTTRPSPSREDVLGHVRWLIQAGALPPREIQRLVDADLALAGRARG
jgi:hypothetical protein